VDQGISQQRKSRSQKLQELVENQLNQPNRTSNY